jgi:hypothetical protein
MFRGSGLIERLVERRDESVAGRDNRGAADRPIVAAP